MAVTVISPLARGLHDERQARGHGAPESQPGARVEYLPISAFMGKDSLAVIVPAETAVGRQTATARRLVEVPFP